ncbi:class I SAM-dependent RNA methyltransferase [Haloglycomyces albus]|uniref:class I SAM-dependent RNA methyltransferase n=1 Tax=Haloglycomyces albus TaxID=526067 RepID=UPI00046D3177|nr:TRAM domain-containing protein [Haloglycomyces albus]
MIITVEDIAAGGHCIARVDGDVYFIRHALPGEKVRIKELERKKNIVFADAVEIIEASADRVTPPCRWAGPGRCGGCDFQHVDPAAQRTLKSRVLVEQLTRLGKFDMELLDRLATAEDRSQVTVEELPGGALHWRTRMQYAVGKDGRPGLRSHRSKNIVHIDECLLASDAIAESDILDKKWFRANARRAHGRRDNLIGAVGVVESDAEELSVFTQRSRTSAPRLVEGPKRVHQRVGDEEFELDYDGFWQVHPHAADTFRTCVLDFLQPQAGEAAWDLYAGAGLYATGLADAVGDTGRVVAVENSAQAHTVANLQDFPNAGAIVGDVGDTVEALGSVDLVVLDPTRAGAGREVMEGIAQAGPRAICYVACDAAALARDARTLVDLGWEFSRMRAFDAFPMTQHFETIALFEKTE